ncbi:glycosyltransferase family 4 protein [Vibrio rotiferianus]|uniref:glycosyltransferase family 4 protein n=1 Tax=Vibrio rotiferianus TaxID=190895 RepID=UPI00390A65A6
MKIKVFGPHLTKSRGGMSTALKGFVEGVGAKQDLEYVSTQIDNERSYQSWRSAIRLLLASPKQDVQQTVGWFHMGPWLSMVRKWSLACIAKAKGAHCIAHFHSPTQDRYLSTFLGRLFTKFILLPFDQVVVLTPWWKERFSIVTGSRSVHVVSNPLEQHMIDTATQYMEHPRTAWQGGKLRLLSMARLVEGKGVELVIKGLACLPDDVELTIAGDGPMKPELEKLAEALGVQNRVTFVGWVDTEQKSQLLKEADIFCLPSEYDSFGMVFIEAMAYSLPVIAFGWGPITDVVTPETGVALDSNLDEQSFAQAVCHIKGNYASYMGKGPQRVMEHFTTEKVVAQFDVVLERIDQK